MNHHDQTVKVEDSDYEEVPEPELTKEQEKAIEETLMEFRAFNLEEAEKAEEFTQEEQDLNLNIDKAIEIVLSSSAEQQTQKIAQVFSEFECNNPPITFADYLAGFRKYGRFSHEVLVAAVIYVDWFTKIPGVSFNRNTILKIFLTALTVAQKMLMDLSFDNVQMAKIGHLTLNELNRLEILFLKALDYDVYIKPEVYQKFERVILKVAYEQPISSSE